MIFSSKIFSEESYYKEKFAKLSLLNEIIPGKVFEECEFSGCSILNCKLEKTRFLNCFFKECTISALIPLDCRFNEVMFSGCKVIGVDWTKAQYLRGLAFNSCQLNYSNFKLLKIPRTIMTDCEAKEVDFTEADLSHTDFRCTDLAKSIFFKSNLTQADFRGAKNYYIDINNSLIRKAKFSLPEALNLLKSLDISIDGD